MALQETASGRSAPEIVARTTARERRHFDAWMEQLIANQKEIQVTETPHSQPGRTLLETIKIIFH